ncbi:MAG: isoprenylcysteine carboxylmethyltransferase family protein [Bauldia sp.]
MSPAAIVILGLVSVQRLAEVVYAEANMRRLVAAGGIEFGRAHYPWMIALHTAWLVGLWLLADRQPIVWAFVALFALIQVGRAWVLATLGRRWTTRVVVIPGERLVARGPYRLVNHPNYVVVAAEIACLPLAFGLPWYALGFSLLNAAILAVRIRVEDQALAKAVRPA